MMDRVQRIDRSNTAPSSKTFRDDLCSSVNMRNQVSHPYKTTGKIMGLYILIFMFLDSRQEDKRSE
jgi:hypothetical protein